MIARLIEGLPATLPASSAAEVKTDDAALQARRMNFIKTHQLSRSETAEIPAGFDPGPEFD